MSVIWELVGEGKVCLQDPSTIFEKQCIWVVENVQESRSPRRPAPHRIHLAQGCVFSRELSSPGAVVLTLWLLLYFPRAPVCNQPAAPSCLNQCHRWSGKAVTWDDILPITLSGRSLPSPWSPTYHPHLSGTLFYIYLLLVIIYYYYIYYLEVRVGSIYSTTYGS